MIIRKARLSDASQLAELSKVLGYPVESEILRSRIKRILSREDHHLLVGESRPGEVAGWIHAAEQDVLESGRSCEILGLVVAANQRGRGVGRRLIEGVEQWASNRGLKRLSVRSNVSRTESHPFYERLGFVRVKSQHAYTKDGAKNSTARRGSRG